MILSDRLLNDFPSDVRSRGRAYFNAGRVKLESVQPTEVTATVRGSSRYIVDLEVYNGTIIAGCDCPYGAACKHIWATILAAEPKGFGRMAAEAGELRLVWDGDDGRDADGDYHPPPRPAPAPKRETWKDQFDALRREVAPTVTSNARAVMRPADRQLVFLVDLQASESYKKLTIDLNCRERKVDGDWSKPQPKNVSAESIAQWADLLERRICALLSGADRTERYSYGYGHGYSSGSATPSYRIAGPVLDTVLPLLAETGRIFLRRPAQPAAPLEELTPDLDTPWVLSIGVKPGAKSKQWVLGGSLRRGGESMPLAEPALIIPGVVIWNGRLGRFDDAGAFTWVTSLRRIGHIAVPAASADQLIGELYQFPQLPDLELPEELRYAEVTVPPKPRLAVKAAKGAYDAPMLRAELSFDYDGALVPHHPLGRGTLDAAKRRFLLRDTAAESAALSVVIRIGARFAWGPAGEILELKPALLPKLVAELVPAGWKVEADGKLYRNAGELTLKVRSEQDWFDLDGAADFGGTSVTFPKLLEALRRGQSSIPLDDGSFGMLPEDWLKKYGLLAAMGRVDGDAIRFSKAQVGVLDALLASRPEVTFDRRFARARDQLRKFTGVAAADPPKAFRGELREYQREGLGWLRFIRKFGFGGCLADDMGLGKTVQVLALLAGKRNGPALVVVPKSLIFNWKQEAAKFAPKLKVLDHTGTARDRTGSNFGQFDIVLTTYGTLRNDADAFAAVEFDTCVLDESQAAKNAATETAKAVRVVRADHRIAMSGTPIENHLGELWTLFDFLNPGMLGRGMVTGALAGSIRNPDEETRAMLARAIRPYILRRTKDQVAKDLPQKSEQTVYCDLEPAQRQLYDELRAHYRQSLLARVDSVGLAKSKIHVLEALLRLRQAACHPGLIDRARRAETSAKLEILLPQLRELAESGCKALVFSQFTSLLSIVRDRLDADGVTYEYLDGKTVDRAARVEKFQTDPETRLFLISLKAGGVGLNLTAAEYVFLLDPWWNPAVEAQAIDRSHRIGQTKPVFAYRLIARGTVEEKVLALQQSKRALADSILSGDGRLITDLKREDLELLLS